MTLFHFLSFFVAKRTSSGIRPSRVQEDHSPHIPDEFPDILLLSKVLVSWKDTPQLPVRLPHTAHEAR